MMSRHLATNGDVVISLGNHSEEGEVLKVVEDVLLSFVGDEEENLSLEFRVIHVGLFGSQGTIARDGHSDLFKVRLGEIGTLGGAHV